MGTLTFTSGTPSGSVNLTSEGTADWIDWGKDVSSSQRVNQLAPANTLITDYNPASGDSFPNDATGPTFIWTNGTPTVSYTGQSGQKTAQVGNSYVFSAVADTNTRHLTVYVALRDGAVGMITASLSDNSASPVTDTTSAGSGLLEKFYTFSYLADTVGNTLNVTWKLTNSPSGPPAGAYIRAATLAGMTGDPHFIGYDGVYFDYHGVPNNYYNLLHDKHIIINALFKKYDAHTTLVTELGVTIRNGNSTTQIMLLAEGAIKFRGRIVPEGFCVIRDNSQLKDLDVLPPTLMALRGKVLEVVEMKLSPYVFRITRMDDKGYKFFGIQSKLILGTRARPSGIIGQTACPFHTRLNNDQFQVTDLFQAPQSVANKLLLRML